MEHIIKIEGIENFKLSGKHKGFELSPNLVKTWLDTIQNRKIDIDPLDENWDANTAIIYEPDSAIVVPFYQRCDWNTRWILEPCYYWVCNSTTCLILDEYEYTYTLFARIPGALYKLSTHSYLREAIIEARAMVDAILPHISLDLSVSYLALNIEIDTIAYHNYFDKWLQIRDMSPHDNERYYNIIEEVSQAAHKRYNNWPKQMQRFIARGQAIGVYHVSGSGGWYS